MSEMVERVARVVEAHLALDGLVAGEDFDRSTLARVAIQAMWSPTHEMRTAGGLAFNPDDDVTIVTAFEAEQAWKAMIDAALCPPTSAGQSGEGSSS